VLRGSTISILVSLGPKIVDTPAFAGMPETEAIRTAQELGFVITDPQKQFSADVPATNVIAALGPDGAPLPATYPVGGAVTFVISLGPIPNVVGQSAADATKALTGVGLVVGSTSEEFSDAAVGTVIAMNVPEGVVTQGTNVSLVISKGPDLVEVPGVVGRSIADAIAALQAAGFAYSTEVDQELWDSKAVRSQSPAGGQLAKRGSTVTISNR
jgi:serine/threonine-protein kinase